MNPDRHAVMERKCEYCGSTFMARVERVNAGQGRFCSLEHANLFAGEHPTQLRGYENGKKYKSGEYWLVRWYDEDGGQHSTSYPKWWWTMHKGEVPDGYVVSHKDENPQNVNPRNFVLVSRKVLSARYGSRLAGVPKPTIAGANSRWWKGGSSYDGYPSVFSHAMKKRIKIRDNYTCQCCYCEFETRQLDVHHIDKNVDNNEDKNLVTICKSCHRAIHGTERKSNKRIRFFQSLLPQ